MTVRVDIDDWIARIRSRDPMTFEDAYFGARPADPDVVVRLVAELHQAVDGYTRGKFCELLGEMGDESVIPILERELENPDENVRVRAALALEELRSDNARAAKNEYLKQFGNKHEH